MVTEYDSPRDRAVAALAEFRRRVPLMTGFARSFSGNKRVRIVPSGRGSFTDGNTVHLEVPLTLADKVAHVDSRCDQWDSLGFQMCSACAIRDDLNYQLFHEISHIWGGSFESVGEWELHAAVELVKQYLPGVQHPEKLLEMVGEPWMAVSYRVHPFIKELNNCFEDARVNGLMAKVRPGVRRWRRAFELRLIDEGVRRFDPRTNTETRFHPGEASLNAQMAYALYFMAAEGKIPPFVDKYVANQLADPRVQELIAEALGNELAEKSFEFAVRAYALMADMGFFGNEDKLQAKQEQDEQGAPDDGDNEDQSEEVGESDQPGESEDSDGGEGGVRQEDEDAPADTSSVPPDDSTGSGDDSAHSRDEASPDEDLDAEGGQDGGAPESSDRPGDESDDDGEASDGVAEEAADSQDPGEAESAHEGEDDPGAGGESAADEVDPDEGDECADGSNPGDSGEADATPEGDEVDASEGEGSLEEGGDPSDEDLDDSGGSGEVSDAEGDTVPEGDSSAESSGDGDGGEGADPEAGSEGDGPGAGDDQGEAYEDESDDPYGDDDASGDSGGDHGERSDDPGVGDDGACESSTEDEADAAEGGAQGGREDDPAEGDDSDGNEDIEAQDSHGTGQSPDSTEGESGGGQDDEVEPTGGGERGGDDLEASDRDDVDDGEAVDRPDAGIDDNFAGDTSGESDGNAGTHGSSGASSGMDGEGNSDLSDASGDVDPNETEGADVAPVEPQDDAPPVDREWGDVEEVHDQLEELFGHNSPNEDAPEEETRELERLVNLGDVFDEIPRNVTQVWWNRWGKHYHSDSWGDVATAWTHKMGPWYWFSNWSPTQIGIEGDFRVSDAVIGKALLKARVAFSDNARKKEIRNLKSGRVNARVLGRRAPVHDARLFKKVARPGRRDYFVVIGLDLSASTASWKNEQGRELNALALIKRSAMAQAEILSRLGVKFAIYGHSCNVASDSLGMDDFAVNMYVVKEAHEPWNEAIKRRLECLGPDGGNLDGHTLQLYRKIAEKETATDKIIMYYTDGEIPAANGEEEGHILVKQIQHCRKEGIALMGVGVGTDSLAEFGFDYTRVDGDEDIVKVVNNLEKRLAE